MEGSCGTTSSTLRLRSWEAEKFRLRRGDLLFNRTNSVELVGKCAVYADDTDAIFASYLIRFRLRPEAADPRFVCTYINSPLGKSFIAKNLARAVGQANISASTMHGMPVPVPSLREQVEISDALDKIGREISGLDSTLQECLYDLDRTTRALMHRAFSGGV